MQVQFPSTNVIRHVDSTSIEGRRALEGQTNVLAAERAIGPIPNHLPPSQVVEGTPPEARIMYQLAYLCSSQNDHGRKGLVYVVVTAITWSLLCGDQCI